LRDGSFLPEHLVAAGVLTPIQRTIKQLEQHLSSGDTPNREGDSHGSLQDLL
jgi:hypothetical protein